MVIELRGIEGSAGVELEPIKAVYIPYMVAWLK